MAGPQGFDTANKLLGKAFQAFCILFDRHAQARRALPVLKPGDAVFATFRSPEDCLAVCCRVLSDLEQLRLKLQEKGLMPLNVHVAAHYTPVLHSNDQSQFFGLPVHLTSRLQGLASEQAVGTLTGEFPKAAGLS